MTKDQRLLALTAAGSALCWWPAAMEPGLEIAPWIFLVLTAVLSGLSALLSRRRRLLTVGAATVGTLAAWGIMIFFFPLKDGIANSYRPLVAVIATGAVCIVSLLAFLLVRWLPVLNTGLQRIAWAALLGCVAFGPAAAAMTPPVVALRTARNDRLAVERFRALQNAAKQTKAEAGASNHSCDAQEFRRNYSGPPFSEDDWRRITGNYVKQDGYVFMAQCFPPGEYKIDALPAGGNAQGARHFCTDRCSEYLRAEHLCSPCTVP